MALAGIAERFCPPEAKKKSGDHHPSVNLLGVTPLDFSVTGTVEAMRALLEENGYPVVSCWAMGSTWEELMKAGEAQVNLVVSSSGLALAKVFKKRYGTPYVTGIPMGHGMTQKTLEALDEAFLTGREQRPAKGRGIACAQDSDKPALVIGEAVWAASMCRALEMDFGLPARALCPLELSAGVLDGQDILCTGEVEIAAKMKEASVVIGDPLYKGVLPQGVSFLAFPHEGYSGRIWRKEIPVFAGENWNKWMKKGLEK